VVGWLERRYPGRVRVWAESPRLSRDDAAATEGGTHKSGRFGAYQKGESAVVDCLLLARSQHLVKNRSGLSQISLMFNPALIDNWTFVFTDDMVWSMDTMDKAQRW
jgi:hypothetical protein